MDPVPYSSMKSQLELEVEAYLKDAKTSTARASKPEVSYQKGVAAVSFTVEDFSKADIIRVLDILKDYYRSFTNFEPFFSSYKIVADLGRTFLDHRKDEEKKADRTTVEFELNRYGTGFQQTNRITFAKETNYGQDEINCILQVWKEYALRTAPSPQDAKAGAKERLEKLGAVFYEPDRRLLWSRIAGYDAVKVEIRNTIVLPLLHPELYKGIAEKTRGENASSNSPRAVLFQGPPGTGKTTLAKVTASESGVPLIYVPIESIMSMWYGESEKRLASIFDESGKLEKSILFLDEIDSLAGSRDNGIHEATRRVLSVLLRKMQGLASSEKIITLGATNKPESLDNALVSRFNRTIKVGLPTLNERKEIFNHYARQLNDADLEKLAQMADGASGRDIEDICSDAERACGALLIATKRDATPPSSEMYVEAARTKFGRVEK